MAFTRIGELLVKRRFMAMPVKRATDAMAIINAWPHIIEDVNCVEKFARTRAVTFRQGNLTIIAASNAVAGELRMCEDAIKTAYLRRFGTPVIQRLIIHRH